MRARFLEPNSRNEHPRTTFGQFPANLRIKTQATLLKTFQYTFRASIVTSRNSLHETSCPHAGTISVLASDKLDNDADLSQQLRSHALLLLAQITRPPGASEDAKPDRVNAW